MAFGNDADNTVNVSVNDEQVNFIDQAPYISNGRTMIPVKFVAESMGAEVLWDDQTRTVTISKDDTVLKLVIDSDIITVNGSEMLMDTASVVTNGRTCVPILYIAEGLGAEVSWQNDIRTVTIDLELTILDKIEKSEKSMKYVLGDDSTLMIFDNEFIHSNMASYYGFESDNVQYAGFLRANDGIVEFFGRSNSLDKDSPLDLAVLDELRNKINEEDYIVHYREETNMHHLLDEDVDIREIINPYKDLPDLQFVEGSTILASDYYYKYTTDDNTNYDWLLKLPKGIDIDDQNLISIKLFGSNLGNDHYKYSATEREHVMYSDDFADRAGLISLCIFTVEDDEHGNAYQLDHIFSSKNPFYKDAHLKYEKIIDDAVFITEHLGVNVNHKVVAEGFSSTAVFAHKLAILVPDRILAIIGGSPGGYLTKLPNTEKFNEFDWPFGMKNVDIEFDKEAFNEIQKFIYCGTIDNECSYMMVNGENSWGVLDHYIEIGATDPERFQGLVDDAINSGYENYYFKVFDNIAHKVPYDYVQMVIEEIKSNQSAPDLNQFSNTIEEAEAIDYSALGDRIIHKFMDFEYFDHRILDDLDIEYSMDDEVIFEDDKLRKSIYEIANKTESEKLYYKDVYKITSLNVSGLGIVNLTGLRYLNNLRTLNMSNHFVKDLNELQYLDSMVQLSISKNYTMEYDVVNTDVLCNMKNLVYLHANNLGLTSLKFLQDIEHLTILALADNSISDISILSKYDNMVHLELYNNPIVDYSPINNMKYIIKDSIK